jgi:hypothetical protein
MRIEFSRRISTVKRKQVFATLLVATLSLLSSSCGVGDKVASVSISAAGTTGTVNLAGLGGTLQLQVNANYTSGKIVDETNFSTYTITPEGYYTDYSQTPPVEVAMPTPPLTVTINPTGMVTAVDPAVCTWVNVGVSATTPAWAYTGDYMVTATYGGFTSQPIFIPVASAASGASNTNGACGPTS